MISVVDFVISSLSWIVSWPLIAAKAATDGSTAKTGVRARRFQLRLQGCSFFGGVVVGLALAVFAYAIFYKTPWMPLAIPAALWLFGLTALYRLWHAIEGAAHTRRRQDEDALRRMRALDAAQN